MDKTVPGISIAFKKCHEKVFSQQRPFHCGPADI